ncbi:MAG TPA: Gfo/Idh/MocA family oxidoreductase, partial [Armatimonadetes bacterium]|nr:Gfo/Idh/MocA family oxidoreductase [Armatimonadota bacterium]
MAEREIGVAMLGAGFMGKAHSNAWARVYFSFPDLKTKPVMKVICGTPEEPLEELADRWGWKETSTDWRATIARDDIQIVDIGTPNFLHHDMAIEAARQGKHIFLEKPMAMDLNEAKEMLQAVREAGVKAVVNFNYRRVPAVQLAKRLIEEGKLGQIYHFRATYLQDWLVDPEFPRVWRLVKKYTGTGVHGDLNAHIIDLARFLVGEFKEVIGVWETFIKERPLPKEAQEKGEVDVDDAAAFLARMENGAIGVFESTR